MGIKYSMCILTFLLSNTILSAQNAHFPAEGSIEFVRSVNMHAQIKRYINRSNKSPYLLSEFEKYQISQPQFKTLTSILLFTKDRTLFTPKTDSNSQNDMFTSILPMSKQLNIVYTDLLSGRNIVQKNVFQETFLICDILKRINWKITSETREIAGYLCRRANAIIMDSIYVVAFYTEKIPVSGGPESFRGLPGMILGVILPYENVSWFARSVTKNSSQAGAFVPPKKGKLTNLIDILILSLKNLESQSQDLLKSFLL